MPQNFCPFCGSPLGIDYIYCPHCGKQLQDAALSFSKQLSVYALSVFLPPFGLWPGVKYLRSQNPAVKRVGIIVIVLTIVSTLLTVWLMQSTIAAFNNTLNSQMQQVQNFGY